MAMREKGATEPTSPTKQPPVKRRRNCHIEMLLLLEEPLKIQHSLKTGTSTFITKDSALHQDETECMSKLLRNTVITIRNGYIYSVAKGVWLIILSVLLNILFKNGS